MQSHGINKVAKSRNVANLIVLLSLLTSMHLLCCTHEATAKIWKVEQLTHNRTYDGWVDVDGPHVAWRGIGENGYIAVLYMDLDDRVIKNLTMDRLYGDFGYPSVDGGQVCWRRISKTEERDSVIFWDGDDLILVDEYDRGPFGKYGYPPSYSSIDPSLSDGEIAYAKWDGNDYEIFYWNGSEILQITDNLTDDYEPQVYQGAISWTGWGGDATSTDVFFWDGTTITNITERHGIDEDSNLFDGIIVNSGVTDTYYNTDIFIWDGDETKPIANLVGFDFEPQIDESLVTWMSWPEGMGNSSVARIWDGYKLFTVDRLPQYVYDPHPGKNGVVFISNDTEPELFLATFVSGTYSPDSPDGEISDVIASHQYTYAYDLYNGVSILTREPDDSLTKLCGFSLQGFSNLVDWLVSEDLLIAATDYPDIQIYDVSDKSDPVFLSEIQLPASPVSIHYSKSNLFVIDSLGEIHVYNLNTPQAPYESAAFDSGYGTPVTEFNGNRLFVFDQGLKVFDVSNPESPVTLLSEDMPGMIIRGMAVRGDRIILIDNAHTIYIYALDLSSQTPLLLKSQKSISDGRTAYGDEYVKALFIGDSVFINTGAQGVFIIDTSNPLVPKIVERIDTFGHTHSFAIGEHYLYTANGNEGLISVDINDYMETIYEDAEDGQISGWVIYDDQPAGGVINNVYDTDRQSQVIEVSGSGLENGYKLLSAENAAWENTDQFQIEWSMKFSERFSIFVEIATTAGKRYLNYTSGNESRLGDGVYVQYGLGSNLNDGQWHVVTRNLKDDFERAQNGEKLLYVNSFLIRGNGLVDDIKLTFAEEKEQLAYSVYEDAEDASTAGWTIYDDSSGIAEFLNYFDPARNSRIIQLNGSGLSDGYKLMTDEYQQWSNSDEFIIEWSMQFSERFSIFVDVMTTRGRSYLNYTLGTENHPATEKYIHYGIGRFIDNGQWHTIVRDLQADYMEIHPEDRIIEVNGFLIRGNGLLDDISLRQYYESIYEDAEDGGTEGWVIYDADPHGATIRNVYDETRESRVIEVAGLNKENGFKLLNKRFKPWENSSQKNISWSMKTAESFSIYVDVETDQGQRYLNYTPGLQSNLGTGTYIHHGLGIGLMDGHWRTIFRDLQADIETAQPGVKLIQVNAFLVRGTGFYDDIYLD